MNTTARSVLFVLIVCSTANAAPPAPDDALAACTAHAATTLSFNGTVYLARHGEPVVEKHFGASDAYGSVPITGRTRFNIGSATKMFTAMAIGILADRGKIRLDAPIARYLQGLDVQFASITVAQLLNHTSGLGDYFNPTNRRAIDAARTATDLLPLVWATPPAFAPGTKQAYSNSGYVVLGAVVETLSGAPYAEFVQREILTPLRMGDTRMTSDGGAVPMTRMSPQGMLDRPQPSPLRSERASPAGGMFSTASDMSVFLGALEQQRLLKPETQAALFRRASTLPARIGHNGGAPGVNAEIWLYPDTGWQLIVLANYDPPVATRMATVLAWAMVAEDSAAACTAALAEPALRTPTQPGIRQ